MRWKTVERNWEAFHEAMLEQWPDLDENDLIQLDGDRNAFEDHLAAITGLDLDDVAGQIDEWLEGAVPADVHMDEHHDNASISESRRYVAPGEEASDDDIKFGDDDGSNRT